jgi:hypothetical protein
MFLFFIYYNLFCSLEKLGATNSHNSAVGLTTLVIFAFFYRVYLIVVKFEILESVNYDYEIVVSFLIFIVLYFLLSFLFKRDQKYFERVNQLKDKSDLKLLKSLSCCFVILFILSFFV